MLKRREDIIREIKKIFSIKQDEIASRLNDFKRTGKGEDDIIFAELVFCILTPQSRARNCWKAVEGLGMKGLLWGGDAKAIADELKGVRFHNKKTSYIIEARKLFSSNGRCNIKSKLKLFSDKYNLRDWLVHNVKGFGYKEASHFLRNIGLGEDMSILDRHILKNLHFAGVIDKFPGSLTRKRYIKIEKKMQAFAKRVKIPMDYLDLLLWYKETGEIFK